ncbi:MAG: translocation/assembly module TamB domain-containing protein [Niabella sp.]
MNKPLRLILRILLWAIAGIVMLVILLIVALNVPAVQNFIKDKVVSYLVKKTDTEISLERIRIGFPKDLELSKLYIADKKKDTLLYADKLLVDIDMWALLKNRIEVDNIELRKVRANLLRQNPDTVFNYQFLIDSLVSNSQQPDTSTASDNSAPLIFDLNKIVLDDIQFRFKDDVAGSDAGVFLGNLTAKVNKFDLDKMHYALQKLSISDTRLHYYQYKPLTVLQQVVQETVKETKEENSTLPLLEFNDVSFQNVSLAYNDMLSDMKASASLNEFNFKDLLLDLTKGIYKASDGTLNNSDIRFAYRPAPPAKQTTETKDTTPSSGFALYLDKIALHNNKVKYDDLSAQRAPNGRFDYNHLNITGLGLSGEGIAIDSTGMKFVVNGISLKDSCGFVLNDLKGKLVYDDKQLRLDNFLLKTPGTYIDNTSLLSYTSQDDLSKHPEKVKTMLNFRKSVIDMRDVYYFVPTIPADYKNQKLNLTATVNGYLNNLDIGQFSINGLKNTRLDMNGKIKGLPDIERTVFDLNIRTLATSKSDIMAFVPAASLPSSINLPEYISASGWFKGTTTNFSTKLNAKTNMGAASVTGTANLTTNRERYDLQANLINFNVGKLLKRDDVGVVNVAMNVKGSGLDPKKINAKIKGTVYSAYYNQYTYKNISIDGHYGGQNLVLQATSQDPNADLNMTANLNMGGKYPSMKGQIDLRQLDLQKLHFADGELKLAGVINMDFQTIDPDYLNGQAHIGSLQIVKDGQRYNVDTISLSGLATPTQNQLTLRSEILNASLDGKYQLTQIAQAFINQINKYYEIGETKRTDPQNFRFDVVVHNSKLLQYLVPELSTFAASSLNGVLNTEADTLIVQAKFPHVIYDSFDIKDISLYLTNRDTASLKYDLKIKSFESPAIQLYNTTINGFAVNNSLDVNLLLRDSKNKDKYVVGGNFKTHSGISEFSLDPQKLLLNYDKWQVSPNNLIQYGKEGIYVRDFRISNSGQSLAVNSTSDKPQSPISFKFNDFSLETLTRYAEQDTSLVGGILNGTALVSDVTENPKFETDLTITDLRYQKDLLGNASIKIDNHTANAFKTDIALSGTHDVKINGYYYTEPSGIDMNIGVNKIDLRYIESITGGQVKNGSGILTGNIKATGSLDAPKVLGSLTFKDAGLTISQLNAPVKLQNETIQFDNNGISFNNFTLRDTLNQPLTVRGVILTKNYTDYAFDLDVRARNFQAMNSTAKDNELFYGTVFLDLTAKIKGNLDKPKVDMQLRINKDTKFTFVIPDDDPNVIEQEGVVEFVDMDAPPHNGRMPINVDSLTRSSITGLDVSGDITINKDAQITILVDPQNGDALTVTGEADLSFQMDPSGKTTLTGRYQLADGSYNLTIGGLARRKFKIKEGSIQWTGGPTEAIADITALYEVNTSPVDLVADQIEDLDASSRIRFKQKLPFLVYLKMKGELLKPSISFELDMPENERNAFNGTVYTKLQQLNTDESELNKQVFALLALNKFISSNPFQSLVGGTSAESLARQSVSRLLTQQLNNLAADLIHGVDINFELMSGEDYSSGTEQTKTDLNVSFSKSLLNDRLTVTVGNNFALEGSNSQQEASQLASNVNIEYMLSRDGRYRLRAYRRNQTEGIIEGQIIETGVGFAMIVDYNRFKEIFNSFKKRRGYRRDGESRDNKENRGNRQNIQR